MADWITGVVEALGYAGIALLTLLENIFPPIPSEVIMPMAGFAAARGKITLAGAVAAGSAGSLAGSLVWFWIGRRIGERRLRTFVERHGRWLTLEPEDLNKADRYLKKHGAAVLFFGRLLPGLRTWISVPAGITGMETWRFLLYSAAGTIAWTALLTTAGYILAENFRAVERHVGKVSTAVFIAIAGWLAYRIFFRKRRSYG